jgi:hypothetical protein
MMNPMPPPGPPMTLGNMRTLGVQPQRRLPSHRADRRVGLSGGYSGAMVPLARDLREVRRSGQQDRRETKLEGAADAREHDREAVAVS